MLCAHISAFSLMHIYAEKYYFQFIFHMCEKIYFSKWKFPAFYFVYAIIEILQKRLRIFHFNYYAGNRKTARGRNSPQIGNEN